MRSFETGYLGNYIHDFSHNSQKIEVKKNHTHYKSIETTKNASTGTDREVQAVTKLCELKERQANQASNHQHSEKVVNQFLSNKIGANFV